MTGRSVGSVSRSESTPVQPRRGSRVAAGQQPQTEPKRKRVQRRGRPGYDVDSLVRASVEVFNDKGFDGTSMEDLSKHLGISKSAIYHHVASKDELLNAALNRALDAMGRVIADNEALDARPDVRLEHLLRSSVLALVDERPYVALLLRVRGNTDIERRAMDRRREFDSYLAHLVEAAAVDGQVLTNLDPRLSARLLFGLVNSIIEWVRPETSPSLIADTLVRIAFHGLFTRNPDLPPKDGPVILARAAS